MTRSTQHERDIGLSSKVDRRKFLKYIGAGVVAATMAGAGYYFYGRQPSPTRTETVTIPKGWETASTWLSSSTVRGTTTPAKGEWWKKAKTLTAFWDLRGWDPQGWKYLQDAGIEVIDPAMGNLTRLTPALGWRKYWKDIVDQAHSRGLLITIYEGLFVIDYGDFIFADGEIWPRFAFSGDISVGEEVKYPLKALYQSPYWSRYFAEKWRNPDGSIMEDPISGGCSRNLGNQIVEDPAWNYIHASFHNPHYLDYVKKCLELDVDTGADGVQLDFLNYPAFASPLERGDFSPWAEHKFKAYLSKAYDEEELVRMRVGSVEEFSLRSYLLSKGYSDTVNTDDPVVKAWSRFEYEAFTSFLQEVYAYAKDHAKSKGNTSFLVAGNIYNLWADSPFTIVADRYSDVTWLELPPDVVPPAGRVGLIARQGWAVSRSKPVWTMFCSWFGSRDIMKYIENDYANLVGIVFAQIYSVGGLYHATGAYPIPFGAPKFGYLMGPKSSELTAEYCRFIHENKIHFLDAKPCRAPIAISYSLPTMMMGFYPSLGVNRSLEWDTGLLGISHVLDRQHIPFDFIILGHPEFWDDSEALAVLPDYDILVLSNAEAMTDYQADAITRFVETGRRLLSFGAIATRDEDYNPRKTSALQKLIKPGLQTVGDGKTLHLSGNPGSSYWRNVVDDWKEDPSNCKRITDAVMSLSRQPPIIQTDGPDTVSISLLQQGDRSFQVHVVNLDYDESDDSVKEKDRIRIKARLPSGFPIEGKEGKLLTPDKETCSGRLEYSASDGYVQLEIPHLRIYSIATLYDPKYFR